MLTIVDSHHKVLLAWAEYRSSLSSAPRLITLDHHTDTSPPFRNFIKEHHKNESLLEIQTKYLKNIDFMNLKSVEDAIQKLNNDEHIVAAIKTDIISSGFVIAHNAANTGVDIYKEHKISCRTVLNHDAVLESSLLDEAFLEFDKILEESGEELLFSTPYILDIDLDYFNTFNSVKPEDSETFKKLIRNAGVITIATEPEYVESCSLEKGLTSEFLLEVLNRDFLNRKV